VVAGQTVRLDVKDDRFVVTYAAVAESSDAAEA
jgi:hypothetical protein